MIMASHILVKTLPNFHRPGLKRACFSPAIIRRLQNSYVLHVCKTVLPQSLPVVAKVKQECALLPVTRELIPAVQVKPSKLKKTEKSDRELLDLRLQLLQKQLRCQNEEVLKIYNSAPRLGELEVLDKLIRNIEIILHLYDLSEVISLVKNRVAVLIHVENCALLNLVRTHNRNLGMKTFIQRINVFVKEEEQRQQPVLLTGKTSYGIMKEKIHYLYSEGVSKDFLKEYNYILNFSMKRIMKEIQYLKKELGEIDHAILGSRFRATQKAKKFRKSLKIATDLLNCSKSDFTGMQIAHLVLIHPGDAEGSIKYLTSLGFSTHDIRSCVYIVGQSREKIDKARHEVLRNCDIDISNRKVYINAILYQIKKFEGFGI